MAVRPQSLKNPERELDISTRADNPRLERSPGAAPDADRLELEARLAEARRLEPTPAARHWLDCWHQGRDAAIVAVERDGGKTANALAIAAPAVIGCGDCFRKGRDAVVRLFEGA